MMAKPIKSIELHLYNDPFVIVRYETNDDCYQWSLLILTKPKNAQEVYKASSNWQRLDETRNSDNQNN